jgi:hypothetical protein
LDRCAELKRTRSTTPVSSTSNGEISSGPPAGSPQQRMPRQILAQKWRAVRTCLQPSLGIKIVHDFARETRVEKGMAAISEP